MREASALQALKETAKRNYDDLFKKSSRDSKRTWSILNDLVSVKNPWSFDSLPSDFCINGVKHQSNTTHFANTTNDHITNIGPNRSKALTQSKSVDSIQN